MAKMPKFEIFALFELAISTSRTTATDILPQIHNHKDIHSNIICK